LSQRLFLFPIWASRPSLSIEKATSVTGLPDPTPSLLGDSQSVHVVQPPATGQIVLVYPPSSLVAESPVIGAGALVSVMPAHIEEGFFQKTLDNACPFRQRRRQRRLLDRRIAALTDVRLRRSRSNRTHCGWPPTRCWRRGEYVYRIEADIDLETTLRIAKSIP
jgi:hypothetical protein